MDILRGCLDIPEYNQAFEEALSKDGVTSFMAESEEAMPLFEANAKTIFRNWVETALSN